MKCWYCIKEEHQEKIKWSSVNDAVCILQGNSYCYKHIEQDLGWKKGDGK